MIYSENYYITRSNFKKMVFSSKIEVEDNIIKLYKEVYDKLDLTPYINYREIKSLKKQILFLEKTEDFLMTLEKDSRIKNTKTSNRSSNSDFIFNDLGSPRYHLDSTCKTLSNNYLNFEVPEEITSRGLDEIASFRKFAYDNRKLLNEGREDVFLLRLKGRFRLQHPIGRIEFDNSGRTSVSDTEDSCDLAGLQDKIKITIEKIEYFRQTEEGRKAIKSYLYASIKHLTTNINLNNSEKELLEFKRDLINLIINYHIRKNKVNGTTFSKYLLFLYGFEPCGKCCAEKSNISF